MSDQDLLTERVRQHVRTILQQLTCYQRELQRCRVERSMTPTMLPYAIETAACFDHELVPLLLYCPSEGCWHSGVWWQGAWRLQGDVDRVLYPTHWLPASTEVVVESDPVERVASTEVVVESDPVERVASTELVVESDPVEQVAGGVGPSKWPSS
jgi:hypothetical protein